MLNTATIATDIISEKTRTHVDCVGCFKIDVINQSANVIYVNRCPIAALTERTFELPSGYVFKENLDLNASQNSETSVDIYVVKYKPI